MCECPHELTDKLLPSAMGLAGTVFGAYLGFWLGGARETAKSRRAHKREIRGIQASYNPSRHYECISQLDNWWPNAIDDYSPRQHRKLTKLRVELGVIQTPKPDWDANMEQQRTPEKEARHNHRLAETRKQAMVIFERIIETL